jgi:hypothetical protein
MTSREPVTYAWGNTLRVRAEVLVTGGRTLSGYLHLQPLSNVHSGPETPVEALNRHESFFPLTSETGTVFLAKSQVLMVAIKAELSADDPDRISAAKTLSMRVQLSDGTEFLGAVHSELRPDRPRVLDFLNLAEGFFGLLGPDGLRFVNRFHIRLVTPLD